MIVAEQFVQEVDRFIRDESLILRRDKAVPRLLLETTENVVILSVKLNLVFVEVVKQIISSKDLCNLHQLVRIAVAMEERFFAENHRGEHSTKTPHIKTVVVLLKINKQLRTLEIARCHAHVVLSARVIEFSQTPIDKTQLHVVSMPHKRFCTASNVHLSVLMIDHNVMRFDISMHDALAVAEVQSLEQLQDVEAYIEIVEFGVKTSEVRVVDILEDEGRCLALFCRDGQ